VRRKIQCHFATALGAFVSLAAGIEAQGTEPGEMGFAMVGNSFVAIHVQDDSTAADWYKSVFGLDEVNHLETEDGRYSIRLLSGPGLSVELTRISGAAASPEGPQLGLFKAGLFVDDIDGALAWLRSKGVETDRAVFTDQALKARSFVFRDAEGNRLQVFELCDDGCE